MATPVKFIVSVDDESQTGAISVDITTPPSASSYTLSGSWGTINIVTTYTSSDSEHKYLIFSATAALSSARFRNAGCVRRSSAGSSDYYNDDQLSQIEVAYYFLMDGTWRLADGYAGATYTFKIYSGQIHFRSSYKEWGYDVVMPNDMNIEFGVPFTLPEMVPYINDEYMLDYRFAGWLPSRANKVSSRDNEYWYSSQYPTASRTVSADAFYNICCLLHDDVQSKTFRRFRPQEKVVVEISDIRVLVSGRKPGYGALSIRSTERPLIYPCLISGGGYASGIENLGTINLIPCWHICTHMPIRDDAGRLLRGPAGRILRDD